MEQLAGSGEKAATACLFSSKSSGQQYWHSFSSVNVSQKANISKVVLRKCKLRAHWAMCNPADAELHQEEELPAPKAMAELHLAWPFSCVIS